MAESVPGSGWDTAVGQDSGARDATSVQELPAGGPLRACFLVDDERAVDASRITVSYEKRSALTRDLGFVPVRFAGGLEVAAVQAAPAGPKVFVVR